MYQYQYIDIIELLTYYENLGFLALHGFSFILLVPGFEGMVLTESVKNMGFHR